MKGALVVFEGLDNVGKTTQINRLTELLLLDDIKIKVFSFPNKYTITWPLIESYQLELIDLHPKSIHLLYSANRWELQDEIVKFLDDGYIVILDRYYHSGIAYTCGSSHVDINWASQSEWGLIAPDVLFYMQASEFARELRGVEDESIGRVQTPLVQRNVGLVYEELKKPDWVCIDADRSEDEVAEQIVACIQTLLLTFLI